MAVPGETRIFGAVLLEQRKVLAELAGDEVLEAVIAALPDDRRKEYEGLTLLSWCRHTTATEVVVRVGEAIGKRPEAFQAEVVRTGVERLFGGIWKVLLRLSSDDALIKRSALLYSKACDRGRMSAESLRAGHVRLTLSEWPDIPDLGIIALAAGIESVMRVVGRKAIITHRREHDVVVFDVRAASDTASSPPTRRA
jgi:hypothetical protein